MPSENLMFKYAKKYFSSNVLTGVINSSYLTFGHIISQLIGLAGVPVIARKLGVENYGTLTLVTAFVGMFSLINLQGTSRILIREGSKDLKKLSTYIEDIIGLKNVLALLSIAFTIIIGLLVNSYTSQIKLFIMVYSLNHAFEVYNSFPGVIYQASQKMRFIAYFSIAKNLLYTVSAIIAVYLGAGVLILLLINLISGLLVLIVNYQTSGKIVKFRIFQSLRLSKKLIAPSIVFSLIGILGYLQTKIDLVMISWLGTAKEVGIYAIAFKFSRYAQMIKSYASTAFFPIFVKRFEEGPVKLTKLLKVSLILFITAAGLVGIFSIFSERIIVFVFGIEYQSSGYILSILLFYVAFGFLHFPFGNAFLATGNEKIVLIFDLIPPILNITLNYYLYQIYGLVGIAYSTLIVMGTMTLTGICIAIYFLKKQGRLI